MGDIKRKKGGKIKKSKREKIAFVDSSELEILSLALRLVVEEKKASTALIQRRLKVGYAQAARLIDRLEELAVITPSRGKNLPALTGYVPVLKVNPIAVKKVADPPKPKIGRPTNYSEKFVKEICDRIAGGESVLQMCRDEHMPNAATVYGWLLDVVNKRDFLDRYEAAKLVQAEVFHDQLCDISDDTSRDYIETEIADGVVATQVNHEHIARSRLRVDTRKWLLARMNPKKYGDKIDVTSGNKPIREPRPVAINYIIPNQPKAA